MHKIISSYPNWETELAPRLVLGLWHPRFIPAAKAILPYCTISWIGRDLNIARTHFWESAQYFSVLFDTLITADGQTLVTRTHTMNETAHKFYRFIKESRQAGKKILVWTVNEPDHMVEVGGSTLHQKHLI